MDQENQSSEDASNPKSATENTQSTNTRKKINKSGSSAVKLIISLIIIVAIAFGAWYAFGGEKDQSKKNIASAVMATVNGEEISGTEFEEFFTKQKALIGDQQNSIDEDVLREQILDLLISKTLLLQKVGEAGVELTTEELDAQLTQIKSQFPDDQAFTNALSEQGFTQESFVDALREDLVIQKYIDSQIDVSAITVTDEEIQAEYDLAITKQDNLPGIDVLGDPIKAQLLQQKQQQLVTELIENLKSGSDIEIIS
jgi:parvulin-like peptidyl-prolyl isomerase